MDLSKSKLKQKDNGWTTMDNEIFINLEEVYGLDLILEQNDIEPWQVVQILHERGLLDVDDYLFTELEVRDED